MPLIKIDEELQKTEEVATFFSSLISDVRVKLPKLKLPKILLAKARPGIDSDVVAASVISRFSEIGIPTGPLEGGQPNVMEAYTQILLEELVDAIHTDMRVDGAVDPGMIVTSMGANAGGPVASTGANPAPHTSTGVPM
jgi:hypothetical protein